LFKNPVGFRLGFLGETHSLLSVNMEITTTPNPARGEATITIGGQKHTIRFGMNVMRDVTKLTGLGTGQFAQSLSTNFPEASTALLACAIKRLPGHDTFTQDDAGNFIDTLSPEENDALAEAMTEAIGVGPLMAALMAKVAAKQEALAPSENGTATSTSLSAT
jgi:hypothetical protein